MIYVIDTDSLIALNRLYTPEFFPDLIDPSSELEQADPYVIALAKVNIPEWRKDLPG